MLREISAEHLRFTKDECSQYFNDVVGIPISDSERDELYKYTEGWIAGVQMAAIRLRDGVTVSELLSSSSRSNQHSLTYLFEEVLQKQPLEIQKFLIKSSILERLNESLCDFVLEIPNSGELINKLRSEHLFTIALDDDEKWFRYHHLLRSLLRELVEKEDQETITELNLRASLWYENAGQLPEAVTYAVCAKDWRKVVQLVRPAIAPLLLHTRELREWLKTLPDEAFDHEPALSVFLAWCNLISGNVKACTRLLSPLTRRLQPDDPLNIQMSLMRATMAWMTRDNKHGLQHINKALQLVKNNPPLKYIALGSLGCHYLMTGDEIKAESILSEAVEAVNSLGPNYMAVSLMFKGTLAAARAAAGRLNDALSTVLAVESTAEHGGYPVPIIVRIIHAVVHLERNELEEAERHLEIAGKSINQTGVEFSTPIYWYWHAMLKKVSKDYDSALTAIERLCEWCKRNGNGGWDINTASLKMAVYFEQLRMDEVDRYLNEATSLEPTEIDFDNELKYLVIAKATGLTKSEQRDLHKIRQAGALAERISRHARTCGRLIDAAHADIVQALIYHRLGRTSDALTLVDNAAVHLLNEGAIRILLDYREELGKLIPTSEDSLQQYQKLIALRGVISRNESRPSNKSAFHSENLTVLSEREQEVLTLIATGLTNTEIAESLVVSLNTVKTHIKNIYFKLEAHSRTQAIARARDNHLL